MDMNGVITDLRSKFENNQMYVINQKSSHFSNNLPNGTMYYPDGQMHHGNHMFGDQLPFSACIPSIMNNHNIMQSSIPRFVNPHNSNSIRQHSIMTSTMMPHGNKNQKTTINNCSITDDLSMSYQATDNFPGTNSAYKSRNMSLDSVHPPHNPNLSTNLINSGNIHTDLSLPVNSSNINRTQAPKNKRSRTTTSRSSTPNVKELMNSQKIQQQHANSVIRPTSSSLKVIPSLAAGISHQKCLPSSQLSGNIQMPYNIVDMIPQQLRPRMPVNLMNSYGCSRMEVMDKNVSIFSTGLQPSPPLNQSPHPAPQFFTPVDNGLSLPMFHLHSRLSKLLECDRLTFPVNHGNLWGPQTLRHGDQITEVQFELNQDNLQQIVNRSDLDIVVTSFTHRDQFRLCHWPEFLELKINGNLLALDSTVVKDLKVHMPCCIKRFCRLGTNILQFTVSKCVCCHLFQTYMVHRPTISHALATIQQKCTSPNSTNAMLSEIYSKNPLAPTNSDDNNSISVISLICPMSQMRITVPARTKCCKHIQPFDLLEFLKVQSKWPQYFCPICRVRVTFNLNEYIENIIIDEVIKEIITQTDANVKRVIFYSDGKWKPVNDIKPDSFAPITPQNLQEACYHEPQTHVIRQSPGSARSIISSPTSKVQHKLNLCSDDIVEKKSNMLSQHSSPAQGSNLVISSKINNVICPSTILSPSLSKNNYLLKAPESHSRSNTPLLLIPDEPLPKKRSKKSPSNYHCNELTTNMSLVKFSSEPETKSTQRLERTNLNLPESIKTSLSCHSASPKTEISFVGNVSTFDSSSKNIAKTVNFGNSCYIADVVSCSRDTVVPDNNLITSTTCITNNISDRAPAASNKESVTKQTSSGSSNPSSPPEFFDPHSTISNYEDDDNSSLHLQRLIGFIDEILSEEEEYVLDTQWASFTWPSADKSLDLLHLSDIEKLL